MSNDNYYKASKGFKPQYDSDEDLPEESRKKVQEAYSTEKQKVRDEEWNKQGAFSKIKRLVKGAWSGDQHE